MIKSLLGIYLHPCCINLFLYWRIRNNLLYVYNIYLFVSQTFAYIFNKAKKIQSTQMTFNHDINIT